MAPLSPMAPTTPSISVSPGILSHVFTTCNDSVLLPITVFNTGSSDLILDTLIGGTLGDSLYSFQNFTFAGAATTHNFTGLPTNLDSLKVTVNMDGDFNSSGEFAELLIDNVNLGVIPDFGQYVVSYTTFITGPQLSSFLADGNLSVVIDNSIQVDIFTSQLNFHEVILEYGNGNTWIQSNGVVNDTIPAGDSATVLVKVNAAGLNAGTYQDSVAIFSNDPAVNPIYLPITLFNNGPAELDVSSSCLTFDTLQQFTADSLPLAVTNNGCDTLVISGINTSTGVYNASPTSLSILPGNTDSIWVQFSPTGIGLLTDTLQLITNANDTNVCLSGFALAAPSIAVNPDTVQVTLSSCNDSTNVPLAIINNGLGPLTFNVNQSGSGSGPLNVLAWTVGADLSREYPNTISGINSFFTSYSLSTSTTLLPSVLQSQLSGVDVLLLPEMETTAIGTITTLASTIQNFVNNGGWVVLCGNSVARVNALGLFNISTGSTSSSGAQIVVDPSSPLLTGVTGSIFNASATFHQTVTNTDFQTVTSYVGQSVVGHRDIGFGKVVYVGFDFFNSNANLDRILANAFVWAQNQSPNWVSVTPTSGTVAALDSQLLNVGVNGSGLVSGTYTGSIGISSNDPATPILNVPLVLNINGSPEITFSDSCVHFDTLMQFTDDTLGLWVYNPGCDTLLISNITSGNGDVGTVPGALTIPPYDSALVNVFFSPDTMQTYTGMLTFFSNAGDSTVCYSGVATGAPVISVNPDSIQLTINCGDSASVPLTVFNTGQGPLNFNFSSASGGSSGATPNVVVWAYAADNSLGGEVANTLNGINNYFTNYTSVTSLTTVPAVLQGLLSTADVLLIPEQENSVGFVNQNMAPVINNFLVSGGWVVVCGTQAAKINDLGFFNISASPNSSTGIQTIVDPSSPLLNNTTLPISNANATFYSTFTDPGFQTVTSYLSGTVTGWENVGAGRAIYIGYDYFSSNPNADRIVANAIAWSAQNTSNWISANPDSGTVAIGDSSLITVTANGTGLAAGTYNGNLQVNSNDPLNPSLSIPVILTVVGTPEIDLSDSCITFDTTLQFTTDTSGIWVFNPGCDSLQISNITASNGDVSFDTTALVIPPFESAWVTAIFAPDTAQNYTGTITIFNNAGDTTICFNGPVIGAPVISVQPDSLLLTVNCDDSAAAPITVFNTGQGPLNFNFSSGSGGSSGATPNVVVWAYAADNSFGGEVANTLNGINNYFTNYTSVTSLTTVPAVLQGLLATADVLLIPEQENNVGFVNQNMAPVINNFLVNGGWVVICGTQAAKINDLGFFTISASPNSSAGIQTIVDPSSPLINNTVPPIANANATFYSTFTDPGFQTVTSYLGGTVSGWEDIGAGKAIYIGYDYFNTTPNSERMVANAIAWAANNTSNWITVSPDSGTVAAGDSTTVTVTANGAGLIAGVYPGNISVSSNDPVNPGLNIPVILTVVGTPEIDLSASCITFDTTQQFTTDTSGIWVYNTGCDSLQISNITASNGDVSFDTTALVIPPYDSAWVIAIFAPDTAQNYSGSITIFNNAGDTTICFTGPVVGAPAIAVQPDSILLTVNCDDSVSVPLTVYNTGTGPLNFNFSSSNGGTSGASPNVVVWAYAADNSFGGEVANTLNGINNYFTNYTSVTSLTTVPSVLQGLLATADVLLIPEQENSVGLVNQNMASVINNFLVNGGWVVICGTQAAKINDLGFFNISSSPNSSTGIQTIVDPSSPLLNNTVPPIANANATFYSTFTDPGFQTVTSYLSGTVSGWEDIGAGKAIYIGYDYFNTTPNSERMVANAIAWAANNTSNWITVNPDSGSVAAGDSTTVTVTASGNGLSAGVYPGNISVSSNDPVNPALNIPVILTVLGTPEIDLSDSCITFDTTLQFTNDTSGIWVYNTGCDSLQVTNIVSSNGDVTLGASSLTVAPYDSVWLPAYFSPDTVQNYTGSITLFNNAGDTTICFTGSVIGAPQISLVPDSIGVTLGCFDSVMVPVTIYNTGNGPLNVNISGGSSGTGTSTNIDVLAWTYGADLSFNGEYNNTINAINNYFTNYNLTATGTTTPSALQSALVGKEVLLIPEQEITNPNPINVLMAPIIQNFLAAGGWVVHCGAQGPKVSSVGVINISGGFSSSGTQTIVDPSSPLLINVTGSIFNTSATFYGNVTTPGFQTVTSYLSQTVSGHIDVGAGKYIYIGFDYFNSNINTERMIANAINWAATSAVPWTTITPATASLAAGASSVVVVKIVSDSLAPGTYQTSYTVASNDPANPFVSLPVHLTVVSTPVLAVTDSCINLGNIPQSQTVTDSMLFSNVGCSPLQVTGTSTSTSALGLSLSSLVVPAGGTDTAFVSYASPVVGPFTETFTLTTNGNDTTICVTGNIVGTSAIAINSPSIGPSIRVCDSISVQTIYVKNNGSQVLSWTYTPTGANPPVLTPATGVVQPSDSIAVIVVVPNAGVVGIQNVQLNFTTNAPSAPTASHTINYQMTNEPCAAYGINVVSTCDGVVQFNDQSVGGVLSYNWNFGDGNSANSANPQHTYAASGVYTVTQVVCGVASCDTLTQTVNVSVGSSVTAATCYPVATAPTASTGITSVQLNTLNNASGNSLEGYQDFSCTIGTQLVVTNSYTLTVTTGGVSQNVKAWIDYNNDGLFAGSELVLQSTGSTHTATVTPATGTVLNVPLRMRVRTGVQVPSSGPCDAPVDGQIEDYFV
ncbi:MAG: beta strand repeat-containing protein, partial [Salibacteraceae bacterium]